METQEERKREDGKRFGWGALGRSVIFLGIVLGVGGFLVEPSGLQAANFSLTDELSLEAQSLANRAILAHKDRLAAKSGFRVLRENLSFDVARPEYCFSFSEPFAVQDRASLAASIEVLKNNKKTTLDPNALSLTPTDLCVQDLDHGADYKLRVKRLKSVGGALLKGGLEASFSVPHRQSSLAFVEKSGSDEMPRLALDGTNTNLILRGINVTATRLSLFRVADPALFPAVWQKRAQIHLAPTESLTFAKDNGVAVWQGDLIFSDRHDVVQQLSVPLPVGAELTPGVYFLAVTAKEQEVKALPDVAGLFAGLWFRVSDLTLRTERQRDALVVEAIDATNGRTISDVALSLRKSSGEGVAEARTDAQGTARLSIPDSVLDDELIVSGVGSRGQPYLHYVAKPAAVDSVSLALPGLLHLDQATYAPDERVTVMAVRRVGNRDEGDSFRDSFVKLLRPDGGFYAEQKVALDKNGVGFVRLGVPAHAQGGAWRLLWQSENGRVLADRALQVRGDVEALRVDVSPDRAYLDPRTNAVQLTIKISGKGVEKGKTASLPLPWRAGRIVVSPAPLALSGWDGFSFGVQRAAAEVKTKTYSFMTDASGVARVMMRDVLGSAAKDFPQALSFVVDLDRGGEPVSITLPVHGEAGLIGVRALEQADAKRAEGGTVSGAEAVFEVVALDPSGRRRAESAVFYQLFEEGRSFRWFQGEGHWNYEPLPQHRRVMGGRLVLSEKDRSFLRLPISSGNYSLEIVSASGDVLARRWFVGVLDRRLGFVKPDLLAHDVKRGKGAEAGASVPLLKGSLDVAIPSSVVAGGKVELPLMWEARGEARGGRSDKGGVSEKTGEKTGENRAAFVAATVSFASLDPDRAVESLVLDPLLFDAQQRAVLRLPVPLGVSSATLNLLVSGEGGVFEKSVLLPVKSGLRVEAREDLALSVGDRAPLVFALRSGESSGLYAYELSLPSSVKVAEKMAGEILLRKNAVQRLVFQAVASSASGREEMGRDVLGGQAVLTLTPLREDGSRDAGGRSVAQARVFVDVAGGDGRGTASVVGETLAAGSAFPARAEEGAAFALLSPVPLGNVVPSLAAIASMRPATTQDLAAWLEVADYWQSSLVSLGFVDSLAFEKMRAQRLSQLQKRQRVDGGFSAWPFAEGDVVSTASALHALRRVDKDASFHAANWLRQKLENVWFEASERPARLIGFWRLASLDPALKKRARTDDPSAARYFATTCKEALGDGVGSPSFFAALAVLSAEIGDEKEARFWFERVAASWDDLLTQASSGDQERVLEVWQVLARLASHPSLAGEKLRAYFEAAYQLPVGESVSSSLALAQLRAVAALAEQAKSWRVEMNGKERKFFGVYAAPLSELSGKLVNGGDQALSVLRVAFAGAQERGKEGTGGRGKKGEPLRIQRQIFTQAGEKLSSDQPLALGQVYVMVLRGAGGADAVGDKGAGDKGVAEKSVLVSVPVEGGLVPLTAARGNMEAFSSLWSWLPPLTQPSQTALTDSALTFEIPHSSEWRVVYLVRPVVQGAFSVRALDVRDALGAVLPVDQSELRVVVRSF